MLNCDKTSWQSYLGLLTVSIPQTVIIPLDPKRALSSRTPIKCKKPMRLMKRTGFSPLQIEKGNQITSNSFPTRSKISRAC